MSMNSEAAEGAEGVGEVTEPSTQESEYDLDFTGGSEPAPEVQNLNPTNPAPQGEPAPATPEQPAQPTEPAQELDDVESLRQQLAEANLKLLQYQRATPEPTPQPQQPANQQPQAFPQMPNEVSNLDFIGAEDHIKLLEDRGSFNALLNKVATVAYNAAVMASQERILRQIPSVVESAASQQLQIKDIVGRFYTTNKDLEAYKPAVSMAAIKLHNDNPSMPLEELLNKAAEETRKVLRIKPGTQARPRVPAQPAGRGRVGGDRTNQSSTLSDQEQQILDLLS